MPLVGVRRPRAHPSPLLPRRRRVGCHQTHGRRTRRRSMWRGHRRPGATTQPPDRRHTRPRRHDRKCEIPALIHRLKLRPQHKPVRAPESRPVVRRHPSNAIRPVLKARPRDHNRIASRQPCQSSRSCRRHHSGPHRQGLTRRIQRDQFALPPVGIACGRTRRHLLRTPYRCIRRDRLDRCLPAPRLMRRPQSRPRTAPQHS